MNDPQNDKPAALLRMAMRLYNSGYHAGHHDTVETGYVDIFSCDMENYHQDEAQEIVQNFLGSNLTDQEMHDIQTIFDDAPLPQANAATPPADMVLRLKAEAEEHQTVYADDRRRKALFAEAAEYVTQLRSDLEQARHDRNRAGMEARKEMMTKVQELRDMLNVWKDSAATSEFSQTQAWSELRTTKAALAAARAEAAALRVSWKNAPEVPRHPGREEA